MSAIQKKIKGMAKLIPDKSQEKSEKIRQIEQPYQEILTEVDGGGPNGPSSGGIELMIR